MLKKARDKYSPSVYVEKDSFVFDESDPFDMDGRATADEIARRGDPEASIEYLVFRSSMKTQKPITIPTVTFSKKGHADKEVSQNNHAMIEALLKSGYKIS